MRSSVPKVLHDLCGLPMVLWPVRAASAAGAERIVVVDSPARALREVLPEEIEIAVQERPDGTGGAVAAALAAVGGTLADDAAVLVLSGDVPLVSADALRELLDAHREGGAAATMATTVLEDPSGYGRVVRDADGAVERVVETKTQGDSTQTEREIHEINTGIFVFGAGPLRAALPRLGSENAQSELYLPQVLEILHGDGALVAGHEIDDPRLVLGVNDRAALAEVRAVAQQAIHRRHMLAGVTIVDPAATVIDTDVEIGADTAIEPFTSIHGATRIGRECRIRHAYILDSVLEDRVSVGPFAYLRPGTVLRAGAKVGTYVEVKNSDIGPDSKIPHLSYIGDADVGARTNLGAATITANYDGRAKHRTTVGDDVKTSVDTTLVAPVTVGDGAYTGAGSVITEDVPPGALGIARARQVNKEGYAGPGAGGREAPQDGGEEPSAEGETQAAQEGAER
jgi:bifunctional UDP-N-acetylglucosamine pyrophosphorylase/glucosamine-1-phosphate N-acetyltransferase